MAMSSSNTKSCNMVSPETLESSGQLHCHMPSGKQHWQLPHNAMCKVCPPPGTIHPLESPWNESKYIWHHLAKANANVKLERSLIDMEWIGANRAKQMVHNTAEIQPFYRTSQFEPGSVSKCITHHNRVVSRKQHWICWKITGLRVYIPPKVAVKWGFTFHPK